MKYYILIKRTGAKSWRGAIPAKRGVSLAKLRRVLRRNLKKGFTARIVTESQLRRLLKRLSPRRSRRVRMRRMVRHRRRRSFRRRRR